MSVKLAPKISACGEGISPNEASPTREMPAANGVQSSQEPVSSSETKPIYDNLTFYYHGSDRFTLLDQLRRQELCEDLYDSRMAFRRSVLTQPAVLQECLGILQQIRAGEIKIDNFVGETRNQRYDELRKNVADSLPVIIRELKKIVTENKSDLALLFSKKTTSKRQQSLQQAINDRCHEGALIVEKAHLKFKLLLSLHESIRKQGQLLVTMQQALKDEARGGKDGNRQLHAKDNSVLAEELKILCQSTAQAMQDYLALSQESCNKYFHVRNVLVEGNFRLVASIANKYARYLSVSLGAKVLEEIDLISEGQVGLLTAIDRFDPRLGFSFSTYASHGIRQSIRAALSDKARPLRTPRHYIKAASALRRALEHDKELNVDDVVGQIAAEFGMPLKEVKKLRTFNLPVISLNKPVGSNSDSTDPLSDLLAADSERPTDQLLRAEVSQEINEALKGVDYRKREILRLRFGLGDKVEFTLEETGIVFGLTREGIRQLQNRALKKLAVMPRLKRIASD